MSCELNILKVGDVENIICMKWGTKFAPDYVNRLACRVRAHMPLPYRFVCFTDDAMGIDQTTYERGTIEIRPLPPMDLSASLPERGWRKLTVLGDQLSDLEGQALFLDLDLVVFGDLTPFFELPGEFRIIHDWSRPWRVTGNSSVFRFELGRHGDVLDRFVRAGEVVRRQYRNEQEYLSAAMHRKGILQYWPDDWCRSFKRHCMRRFPLCHFLPPTCPADTKILVFHGHPHPTEAAAGWQRGWRRRVLPAEWVRRAVLGEESTEENTHCAENDSRAIE